MLTSFVITIFGLRVISVGLSIILEWICYSIWSQTLCKVHRCIGTWLYRASACRIYTAVVFFCSFPALFIPPLLTASGCICVIVNVFEIINTCFCRIYKAEAALRTPSRMRLCTGTCRKFDGSLLIKLLTECPYRIWRFVRKWIWLSVVRSLNVLYVKCDSDFWVLLYQLKIIKLGIFVAESGEPNKIVL